MRTVLGLVALNGVALATGEALLYGLGLVGTRPGELARGAGAALLAGFAVLLGLGIVVLVAGGAFTGAAFTGAALIVGAGLVALGRRRRAPAREAVRARPDRAGLVLGGGLALWFAVQIWESRALATAWDAAHNWTLKAEALFYHGSLVGPVFVDGPNGAHLAYPVLQPLLGSLVFRFCGSPTQGTLLVELWILLAAFVATLPFLLAGRAPSWLALLPGALAAASATSNGILRGDADVLMACLLAAGALALALWVEASRPGHLALGVILLGAAANTKNEGLVFSGLVLVAAVIAFGWRRERSWRPALVALAGFVALVGPWRLWLRLNGPFPSDVTPLSTALHPSFLSDHLDQLRIGVHGLAYRLVDQSSYLWILPSFCALALAGLVSPRTRRLAGFWLGTVLAALASVAWVYWISSQPDIGGHVSRTVIRTITGPLFLCAAGLAYGLTRLLAPAEAVTALEPATVAAPVERVPAPVA